MAAECIKFARAKETYLVYGTDSHTGKSEDFENLVQEILRRDGCNLPEDIQAHAWIDVNGLVFDCKHHIGSSNVPHARHTAIAKERLWNVLWSDERHLAPHADVIIRSHVHYLSMAGGVDWLGITTPALQGMGSKYGARRCSGIVDFGLIYFDVVDKENYTWRSVVAKPLVQRAEAALACR